MGISASSVEELARRVAGELPVAFSGLKAEVEAHLRRALHSQFNQLGLVTQEEFRVQARLLEQTRARVSELEALLTRD
jgi:ubiquinone biosynthesis accessory factor UbiK